MRRAWSSVGSVLEALRHWSKLQGANAFHFLIGSFVQLARDASFIRSWKASFVDWLAIKSHRGAGWLRFEIEQVLKQQRAAAKHLRPTMRRFQRLRGDRYSSWRLAACERPS